jgi:hypothetical protein
VIERGVLKAARERYVRTGEAPGASWTR